MVYADTSHDLLVLGVHLKSEGYPNTLYRLHDLEASGLFKISEINAPMWQEKTQERHGAFRHTRSAWRATVAHIIVMLRYLIAAYHERAYVPYPAVFVLFLLSWLPVQYRPRYIVADVFISLYDTIVFDRQLIRKKGLAARILKWIERRAYVCADKLVVDTTQNAKYYPVLFNLPESKFVVIPLSTDEVHFQYTPYQPHHGTCHILFVGTMVPLHGIKTILDAASLLSGRSDIHFQLIGDGQEAHLVEARLISSLPYLKWERSWQSSQLIAQEISHADICLGIFGEGEKTQRVCPFKIYAYASMGRAIITGETRWIEDVALISPETFSGVPVNDAAALASRISQVVDDPVLRTKLAANSHEFYRLHLDNQSALKLLVSCLLEH